MDPELNNNNALEHLDTNIAATENQPPAPVHPEFSFPDGNIEIRTTDQTFWVHEYHLNKFALFATRIRAAKGLAGLDAGRRIVVVCDKATKGEDIYNTLKVLYESSQIDGSSNFDSSVMISTLRIASSFDYPALRKFAISKLEGMNLPAIQRIQLSDEFSLPTWETPAFAELCSRKEPVSQAEAEVLGMTRFVEIARLRETERTRLAVKFAEGVYGELHQLQTSGLINSGTVQNNFGYSSGSSGLPDCDCRALMHWQVHRCGIHHVAPQILNEGQTLLRQRDELLKQLGDVRSALNKCFEGGDSAPNLNAPLLETELSEASWIRREHATAL
ncbi:hypothetical protein RSOLAG22IIIB_00205 [Rhizoctonia solani]|uniref:BTB domain-containing protein n=1 Tax=Rhizoctonia solani TaxID=456999 RepID=A0A0K6FKR9_9AGAM|nr:hypothetical protein RSOLAG22IIIB_00205 [Rhizoctonia solani]